MSYFAKPRQSLPKLETGKPFAVMQWVFAVQDQLGALVHRAEWEQFIRQGIEGMGPILSFFCSSTWVTAMSFLEAVKSTFGVKDPWRYMMELGPYKEGNVSSFLEYKCLFTESARYLNIPLEIFFLVLPRFGLSMHHQRNEATDASLVSVSR